MTLEQLRIFVCVATRLNMTRAAEELHITQSGVSASISALENTYGTALFDRVGRRIEVSAAGEAFLVEAEKVLRQVGSAQRALLDLSNLRRGSVSVCASQTVGNYYLPEIIAKFHVRWPSLNIALHISKRGRRRADAERGQGGDRPRRGRLRGAGAVQPTDQGRPDLRLRSPDHPWARRTPAPAELLAGGWVLREDASGTRAEFMAGLARLGLDLDRLSIQLELPTNEAVRSAVMAGAGPGALSELVVADALASGALVRVDVALPSRAFTILRHAERKLSRAGDVFIKTLTGMPAECERPALRPVGRAFNLARLSGKGSDALEGGVTPGRRQARLGPGSRCATGPTRRRRPAAGCRRRRRTGRWPA